ncbi:MAG: hypothetical protein GKR94_17560 [Gammaproteobacteria bacterium]|nr:hypothetical protein [Gammaproteobacteria bacterium]
MNISDLGYGADVEVVSEDDKYRTVNITGAESVNASMSKELVKNLTAAYIRTLDVLKAKTPWAKNVGIGILDAKRSGFCGPMKLKYHAGAVAAWEEAGYSVPDCAKP